jgi:hypothetical protein
MALIHVQPPSAMPLGCQPLDTVRIVLQTQRETQTTQEAELPQRIEWKQHELESESTNLQTSESLKRMVELYKADAQENHRCYTCERPFEDGAAVAAFVARQVDAVA